MLPSAVRPPSSVFCRLLFVLSLLLLAGCTFTPDAPRRPAMPTVVPPAPVAPVDIDAVFTRASMRVKAGDFAGAAALVLPLPPEQETALFRGLTEVALEQNAADAARFALVQPSGGAREAAIARIAEAWFARQPDDALTWAAGLREPPARTVAFSSLARQIVATNPRSGLEKVRGHPRLGSPGTPLPGSLELTRFVLAHWARRDVEAALEWTTRLPEPEQLGAVTTIGFEVAQFEPERAWTIAQVLPDGRDRRLLVAELAQTWIARDPAGADAWVKSLAAGPLREAALAGFAVATGPMRAGRGRDAAVPTRGGGTIAAAHGQPRADELQREFERRLQASPSAAASWLETLPPPDVTDEMLRRVAQEWLRYDPAAAATWLHLHVPSPSRRDQILREILP